MSGNEQTFNIVNGRAYGNGSYAKGSAQRYSTSDSPFGSPDLESVYGSTKTEQYKVYTTQVLQANLDNGDGTFATAAGMNSQMGNVDLSFGDALPDGDEKKPPAIKVGQIDGVAMIGGRGTPGGGFVPSPISPGVGNGADASMIPAGFAPNAPYDTYLVSQGGTGMGSQVSPAATSLSIGTAMTLVHNGATPGFRPGRVGDDSAAGGND